MSKMANPEPVINRFRNPKENPTRLLHDHLFPDGKVDNARWQTFNAYLSKMGYRFDVGVILTNTRYGGLRHLLVQHAKSQGANI